MVRTTAPQPIVRPSASSIPGDRARLGQDARRFAFDDGEIRRLRDQVLHRAPIELPVGLGARSLDGRTLAAVEDAKLDAGLVGGARHHAIQRVDLAHQMSLAKAADRRVAGHFADRRETMGHQRGQGAERAAAVAASHPAWPPPMTMTSNLIQSVRLFHVKHPRRQFYFPTHSRANISPSTSSAPIRPTMRSIAAAARRRSSAINSHSAASGPSVAAKASRAS